MTDELDDEKKPFVVKLDPTKMAYMGPAFKREILPGELSLFTEPLTTFDTPLFIVSHEGNADFSIFFIRLDHIKSQFKCELVTVFSFGEILKFLESLKRGFKLIKKFNKIKIEALNEEVLDEETEKNTEEIKEMGYIIHPRTIFFSPNRYFHFTYAFGHELFFGRKVGEIDGDADKKPAVLYYYSVKLPHSEVIRLYDVILKNIERFEEKHKVSLSSLCLKKEGSK